MRKNRYRGTYNQTKTKVLVYLAARKDAGDSKPVGLSALVAATGTNYGYLKTRLRVWSRWGYLHCHTLIPEKGRPFYGYSLARNGRGFVEHLNRPYRPRKAHPSVMELGPAGSYMDTIPYPGQGIESIPYPGQGIEEMLRPRSSFLGPSSSNPDEDDMRDIASEFEISEDDIS